MNKFFHYLLRASSILIVLFFGVFILEGFSPQFHWQDSLSHLLLTVIVLIATILAWTRPKIGGWLFVGLGILASLFFHPFIFNGLVIGGVFLLSGVFYLIEMETRSKKVN